MRAIATLFKRHTDLILPKAVTVSGLLVLKYYTEHHPTKRPKVYTGELEHIVQSTEEHGIGLLSTVEWHKIVVAVKEKRGSFLRASCCLYRTTRNSRASCC
jgi:hypothetical protein